MKTRATRATPANVPRGRSRWTRRVRRSIWWDLFNKPFTWRNFVCNYTVGVDLGTIGGDQVCSVTCQLDALNDTQLVIAYRVLERVAATGP